MQLRFTKIVLILVVPTLLNASFSFAQSETSQEIIIDQITDPANLPSDAISETELETEPRQVGAIEQEYLMKGYSLGAIFLSQNYNLSVNAVLDDSVPSNVSSKSPDYQSVGVAGRYAILPYNKIGGDINISISNTFNHESLGVASFLSLRGEVNLGYAFMLSESVSFYILAGLGYEVLKGSGIEEILVPGGGGFQVGSGFGLGKKFDFEVVYSYSKHNVSDKYYEKLTAAGKAIGATSVVFDKEVSRVISNTFLGRLTYNY